MGEVFDGPIPSTTKSQGRMFYAFYFLARVCGFGCDLPGAPLVLITLFVQVVAVILLPAALVFLLLL